MQGSKGRATLGTCLPAPGLSSYFWQKIGRMQMAVVTTQNGLDHMDLDVTRLGLQLRLIILAVRSCTLRQQAPKSQDNIPGGPQSSTPSARQTADINTGSTAPFQQSP